MLCYATTYYMIKKEYYQSEKYRATRKKYQQSEKYKAKQHLCGVCDGIFELKIQLKNHMDSHRM